MFNLKSAALGAAFLGTAATMTLTAASAQALTIGLGDILNITGQATFSLDPTVTEDTVDFTTGQVETDSTGGFYSKYVVGGFGLLDGGVSDIDLTLESGITYTGYATNPLLAFDDDVRFFANNPFEVTRFVTGTSGVTLTFEPFSGTFTNASGAVIGEGLFTAQQFLGADGSYSMTIEAVPEPLTMLGAGAAIAFGGAFKRKLGKKNEKGSTKA